MPTPPRNRWFQFSIWQIMEATFWGAIGVAILVAVVRMSQEQMNSIFVFAIFLPGAPFGAAVGALIGHRLMCAVTGGLAGIVFVFAVAGVKML